MSGDTVRGIEKRSLPLVSGGIGSSVTGKRDDERAWVASGGTSLRRGWQDVGLKSGCCTCTDVCGLRWPSTSARDELAPGAVTFGDRGKMDL